MARSKKIIVQEDAASLILNKIDEKLDKLDDKIDHIVVIQAQQGGILEEHKVKIKQLEESIGPLKTCQSQFMGGLKLLGIISLVLGIVGAILKLKS